MSVLLLFAAAAAAAAAPVPPPADPLTVEVEARDAERFAALFERTKGAPTPAQVQRAYLDGAGYGVRVFTPGRIRDAAHLARTVVARRDLYARAVRDCLPVVRAMTPELRATYLAWRQFRADLTLTRWQAREGAGPDARAKEAIGRWVGNYGSAPPDWPGELGYWIGRRIWERWYARQPDKRAAVRRMLTRDGADAVLAAGGFSR